MKSFDRNMWLGNGASGRKARRKVRRKLAKCRRYVSMAGTGCCSRP